MHTQCVCVFVYVCVCVHVCVCVCVHANINISGRHRCQTVEVITMDNGLLRKVGGGGRWVGGEQTFLTIGTLPRSRIHIHTLDQH